jgi:hypothetical protein
MHGMVNLHFDTASTQHPLKQRDPATSVAEPCSIPAPLAGGSLELPSCFDQHLPIMVPSSASTFDCSTPRTRPCWSAFFSTSPGLLHAVRALHVHAVLSFSFEKGTLVTYSTPNSSCLRFVRAHARHPFVLKGHVPRYRTPASLISAWTLPVLEVSHASRGATDCFRIFVGYHVFLRGRPQLLDLP